VSHDTNVYGDKTTLVAPFVEIAALSDNDSVAPNAQHEPHCS